MVDSKRAQEIVESLGVIEVLYKNAPVWIEQLDGQRADVRYLETGRCVQVPVTELVEGDPV
jgi:small acid-soluble spore protein H (minor)